MPATTSRVIRHHRSRLRSSRARRALVAGLGLVLVVGSVGAATHRVQDDATAGPPGAATGRIQRADEAREPLAGQLTLRNASAVDLRIEVRLARRGATCDQAPAGTVHVLPAGRRWLIATRSAVCWRRAPDLTVPVTEWLPWERRVLGPAQRLEIRL